MKNKKKKSKFYHSHIKTHTNHQIYNLQSKRYARKERTTKIRNLGHVVIGKIKIVASLIMKLVKKTVLMILYPQGKFQVNSLRNNFLFHLPMQY